MKISHSRLFLHVTAIALATLFFLLNLYYYPITSLDGSLYLYAAAQFKLYGYAAVMKTYFWPFYPIVISFFSSLTGLSLLHAGYFINYLFFSGTVLVFLSILDELGCDVLLQWVGLLVLFSFHPFVKLYADIVRDTGYYFFYLLSILLFLKFAHRRKCHVAFLWSVSTFLALLFRIEGIFFLTLMPLFVFVLSGFTWREKIKAFFKLNAFSFLGCILAVGVLLVFGKHLIAYTGRFDLVLHMALDVYQKAVGPTASAIVQFKQYVINPQYAGYAGLILMSGMMVSYFYVIACLFGLVNIVLAGVGVSKKPFSKNGRRVLFFYVFVNLFLTCLGFFVQQYTIPRYFLAMLLTLLPFAAVGLQQLYRLWRNKKARSLLLKFGFPVVILLLLFTLMSSVVHVGPSKRYIKQGVNWVNKRATSDTIIFAPEVKLHYYLKGKVVGWLCKQDIPFGFTNSYPCFMFQRPPEINYYQGPVSTLWFGTDYAMFIVRNKKELAQLNDILKQKPVKIFRSNRSRRLVIYKLNRQPGDVNIYIREPKWLMEGLFKD